MPPNNTIVAKLTADPRDMQRGFSIIRNEVIETDRTFARLDARLKSSSIGTGGGIATQLQGVGTSGKAAAQGMLEASRGVEDFFAGFANNGISGGIRAANNNLSQMALVLGGPVAGAVAGFAAAGLSIAAPYISQFFKATTAARDFKQELENLNGIVERSQKLASQREGFRQLLGGIDTSGEAKSALKDRQGSIADIDARLHDLNRLRQPLRERAAAPAFGAAAIAERDNAAAADRKLFLDQLELMRQRAELVRETNKLKEKSVELSKKEAEIEAQKLGQDAAKKIAEFQKQDLKDQIRDAGSGMSFLQQAMQRNSPDLAKNFQEQLQLRDIGNLQIPDDLKAQLTDAMQASFNAVDPNKAGALASRIEAGSGAAAAALFQDKQKDQQLETAKKTQQTLENIFKAINDAKRQAQDDLDNRDTINLDG